MKFSVIMPAYNVDRYIDEAVNSIIAQTFTDWELIIVDDCSTDGTLDKARHLAETDNRIKVLTMPSNSGRCLEPRLKGARAGKGDYLCMVDADDVIEHDYLVKIARRHEETGADVVLTVNYSFSDDIHNARHYAPKEGFDLSQVKSGKELMPDTIGVWEFAGGGGSWRRELYIDVADRFDYSENPFADECLARQHIFEARKIAFSDARYFYRFNHDSVTHKLSLKLFAPLQSIEWIVDFTNANYADRPDVKAKARKYEFIYFIEALRRKRLYGSLPVADRKKIDEMIARTRSRIDFRAIKGHVSPRLRAIALLPLWLADPVLRGYDAIRCLAGVSTSDSQK